MMNGRLSMTPELNKGTRNTRKRRDEEGADCACWPRFRSIRRHDSSAEIHGQAASAGARRRRDRRASFREAIEWKT